MRTAESVRGFFLGLIHKYEQGPHGGFAKTVYLDEGKPCIGYGHDIDDPNDPLMTAMLDQQGADDLAMQDGEEVAQQLDVSLGTGLVATLTDQQFAALLDFVFNLGIGQFNGSTLKHDILIGQMSLAADQFPRWCHAGGVQLAVLLARRNEEKALWTGAQTSVM